MTISQAIEIVNSANLDSFNEKNRDAILSTREVLQLTTDPDVLRDGGFDKDLIAIAKKIAVKKPKGKSLPKNAKLVTPKNTAKPSKTGMKPVTKPRPKKETPAASTTATKADSSSSAKTKKPKVEKVKADKPKAEKKPAKVKAAKPEKVKKPTADEKAADKARAEIMVLDRDIAAYEKRIKDDSGIVDRISASWIDQSKSIKGTLGALPDKLREELLLKRRKKAILAKIIKRDAKYFESAAKTLKKANQLPTSLASDLESVSETLGSLNRKQAEKKTQAAKPQKKGFFQKIFG